MIKKAIIAIVVMLAAAAVVLATSENQANYTNNSTQEKQQSADNINIPINTSNNSCLSNNSVLNTSNSTSNESIISSAEAKEIAEKYIEDSNASAGTPTLTKSDAELIYIVPVIENGTNVGEIDINALTGENVGGAGGAP
jgi:hypothetical protein